MAQFNFSSTDSTITVNITNMITEYWRKRFTFYIDRNLDGTYDTPPVSIEENCFYGNYTYTYDNLQPGTEYFIAIQIEYSYYGNFERQINGSYDGSYSTSGGGGGTNATYVFSIVGSNINIDIINADSNCQFYAYLYDNPYGSGSPIYNSYSSSSSGGFAGIPDGTYYLNVYYSDYYTAWTDLQNYYTGYIYSQIIIGGGSGIDPTFTVEPYGNDGIRVVINDPSGVTTGKTRYVSVDNIQRQPTIPSNNEWISTGWAAGTYTINVDYADGNWVPIAYTGGGYSTTVTVGGSPQPGDTPTYTAQVVNNNQIQMTVSNRGNYYLRYFVRRSDSSSATYDSWEVDGQLVTYVGLTVPNLQYNTWYTVNVGYSTVRTSGQVTLIGSQELKTNAQPQEDFYTQISGITVSNTNISTPISFSANHGVIVPITISYSGVITIYTERSGSSNMDDFAYLTRSTNVSYDSNGNLDQTSQYFIKKDDDSHGNYQFQMTIDNTNVGTNTYYIWIRGYNGIAINTVLYATISSGGYVYIYDGSTWRQAIPYIYDGSTWREAIPYVYNGSTWQECGG